jgi:hypothetical protein
VALVTNYAISGGVAGMIALTLGYVAHDHLGLSGDAIRTDACAAAAVLAALVAIEVFGKKWRKPK